MKGNVMTKVLEYANADEARAARKLVKLALAKGYLVTVYDGEEYTLERSSDKNAILAALCTTGRDALRFTTVEGERIGVIGLVWGNSAEELISDCSDNRKTEAFYEEWLALVQNT